MTKLKKLPGYGWLKDIPSQALQDIVQRIEKGYSLFFRNMKHGISAAPPSFKKSSKYKSFTLKQAGWKLLGGNKIKIGQKVYKFAQDREPIGKIKRVTVKRDALGDLYVCLSQEMSEVNFNPTTGKMAGFDFGLKTFLTLYDGIRTSQIQAPEFFKQSMNHIRQANRKLSKKKKGSHNRRRAKLHLARIHKRVAAKRQDWFFKLAHELTDIYDVLFFEDLNLKGMQRMWGRKISDLGFATFLKRVEHVARKKGKVVVYLDRFYPSSKTCSHCLTINKDLELKDRWWRCPVCQKIVDRDGNAAVNIFREGASSLGGGDVRPLLMRLSPLIPETHLL